ncbi:hypothetical protein LAZ67_X001873 [Cordylochernes scorpioides]|uniref:Integrase catalytic domain-containing protein n=1 Tax=Cordylochernes scorpioides TaxID=51811 RepID=A0ABY6LVG5_9ARAC|nr:hypothetical protein LAZ67_X001873 [Cordylochernes scorpioides]
MMAALPGCRVEPQQRSFSIVGMDYFGPMEVSVGRRHEKRYGVLFTCMTTRVIHLEVAHSLTTDSCIMAIRRMICRRGLPLEIFSDNGTNLRGADKELQQALDDYDQEALTENMNSKGIKWNFIPPSAPHMGGSWERLVRSVKTAISVILRSRFPKDEELLTLMLEAEAVVNSRPLTDVPLDPAAPEAITPMHFLIGTSSIGQPPGQFDDADLRLKERWRKAQRLADMFWMRWRKEYLPTLQRRTKWHGRVPDVQVGDMVFVLDESLKRGHWPLGIVLWRKYFREATKPFALQSAINSDALILNLQPRRPRIEGKSTRDIEGRYEVALPWVQDKERIPSNRDLAENQLISVRRKLEEVGDMKEYGQIFEEWMEQGIIEYAREDKLDGVHYLPHRPVYKKNSQTSRIRPVFNASARKRGKLSLNDCLDKGPNLIEIIPRLSNKFRKYEVGVSSDIEKAFLQIGIMEEDRDAAVFEIAGVDLTGHLILKNKKKAWVVIFTCAVNRGVHLELVTSLSMEAFLQAFGRFIARRGRPLIGYSDNGTNFKGMANALKKIDFSRLKCDPTLKNITWKFIPPGAPWWGGWWERLIGMMKQLLFRILGQTSLGYEELSTVMCDVESLMNTRPLTYLTEESEDLAPLTPSLFLHEIREVGVPDLDLIDNQTLSRKYQYIKRVREDLRERFRIEYFEFLRQETRRLKTTIPFKVIKYDLFKKLYNLEITPKIRCRDPLTERSPTQEVRLTTEEDPLTSQQEQHHIETPNVVSSYGRPIKRPNRLDLLNFSFPCLSRRDANSKVGEMLEKKPSEAANGRPAEAATGMQRLK